MYLSTYMCVYVYAYVCLYFCNLCMCVHVHMDGREAKDRNLNSESESCSVMYDSLQPHGLYSPWNSPGQNTGVGSLSLLQGISLTQGSNPGLPHCRWILYQLSHKEVQEYWSG